MIGFELALVIMSAVVALPLAAAGGVAELKPPPQPVTGPVAAAAPLPPSVKCGSGTMQVRTAAELHVALEQARSGDSIQLADGRYVGNFVIAAKGTPEASIELCGGRAAVLDGGPRDGGYTMHLDGAEYWRISGVTVSGGQKGIMLDRARGNVLEGLSVTDIGDEAIHLRARSTDNVVRGNVVRRTGLRKKKFGEGVYIGSAESNWCDISRCEPDRSDRNIIEGNDIAETTSESIDIKEGTTGGIVRNNRFSGAGMSGADSWVDVKGNDWRIMDNVGRTAPEDGFQTHTILPPWGAGNVFERNVAVVESDGYGFNITGKAKGNRVSCDNESSSAGAGLSNIDCG